MVESATPPGIARNIMFGRKKESSPPNLPTNDTSRVKLPAWIGSILFHAAILVLILAWFSLTPSPKSAPGERIAIGSIILQSPSDVLTQAESSSSNAPQPQPETDSVLSESLADISLEMPPNPLIAPGQQAQTQGGSESAANLTESFQQGTAIGTNIGSGETTVQIFGTQGKGTKFMYVFDRSGSMEGTSIHKAKIELLRSLESLNEFHQFNILFYSSEWRLWRAGRKLVFATPAEKQNADQFVKGVFPGGNTQHFEPLMEAVAHRPDVIFFLTDGQEQDNLTADQLRKIEQANSRFGAGIQINVIQFGIGGIIDRPSAVLQQLADQNHGEYRYVNVKTLQ